MIYWLFILISIVFAWLSGYYAAKTKYFRVEDQPSIKET